jgi:hypothetical protein
MSASDTFLPVIASEAKQSTPSVMAGLDPAIHVFVSTQRK